MNIKNKIKECFDLLVVYNWFRVIDIKHKIKEHFDILITHNWLLAFGIFLTLFAFAVATNATCWWVNTVAGDDANGGTGIGDEEATFGAAIADAGPGDTIYAYTNGPGTKFLETWLFPDDGGEGVVVMRYPDSTEYIYIDGEGERRCIQVEQYCGRTSEVLPRINNVKCINGISGSIFVQGSFSGLIMDECSLDVVTGYGINPGQSTRLYVLNSVIRGNSGTTLIYQDASPFYMFMYNTILDSLEGRPTKLVHHRGELEAIKCSFRHFTDYGVYAYYYSGDRFVACDFSGGSSGSCIYCRLTEHLYIERCKFLGNRGSDYAIRTDGSGILFSASIVNTVIDSFYRGFGGKESSVAILNSIFSNCQYGIYLVSELDADGLCLYNNDNNFQSTTDTNITYYTFDPELDADKVAQADSAKIIGVNDAFGLYAPRTDDIGHCFRDGSTTPAIGWRSPYTETECEVCPPEPSRIYFHKGE